MTCLTYVAHRYSFLSSSPLVLFSNKAFLAISCIAETTHYELAEHKCTHFSSYYIYNSMLI